MSKMLGSLATAAMLLAFALPGSASAAESKRADGIKSTAPQATEFSSQRRRWHRPRVWRRYGYRYPRYRYRYPRYYPYYGAYAPYPYYRRYYGPRYWRPGVSFHFGF
ncbi:MAG: hypothetical protein GEU91_03915 [Rhizobiales bacterium]|nr:hypothetical protein [Hyphomicrobiales bacterium]